MEEYNELYKRSGGLCEICEAPPGNMNQTKLHLDHDHKSGQARGILCHKCNRGLGLFQDSPELLNKAANYIIDINNDYLLKIKE